MLSESEKASIDHEVDAVIAEGNKSHSYCFRVSATEEEKTYFLTRLEEARARKATV